MKRVFSPTIIFFTIVFMSIFVGTLFISRPAKITFIDYLEFCIGLAFFYALLSSFFYLIVYVFLCNYSFEVNPRICNFLSLVSSCIYLFLFLIFTIIWDRIPLYSDMASLVLIPFSLLILVFLTVLIQVILERRFLPPHDSA